MNLSNHFRVLTLASMLAFSVVSVPAVQVHAQPNNGGGTVSVTDCKASTWVPGALECSDQWGNTYICTTSDGKTPEKCTLFTQTALTGGESGAVTVHPVIGGNITTGGNNSGIAAPRPSMPVRAIQAVP